MAYTVAANAFIQLTYRGLHWGQVVMNTFIYRLDPIGIVIDGPDGAAAMAEIKAQLEAPLNMDDDYIAAVSSDMTEIVKDLQWISPTRYLKQTYTVGITGTGEAPAVSMPPNVSHVFTLRGDIAVPVRVGTKHIPAVPIEWVDEGKPTGAAQAIYATLAAQAKNDFPITVGGDSFNVLPYVFNRDEPLTSVLVTAWRLGETTRVERRRTVGLGI